MRCPWYEFVTGYLPRRIPIESPGVFPGGNMLKGKQFPVGLAALMLRLRPMSTARRPRSISSSFIIHRYNECSRILLVASLIVISSGVLWAQAAVEYGGAVSKSAVTALPA